MAFSDYLRENIDPADYILSDAEFWAVYDWVNARKDELAGELKWGLLKLINGEEHRIIQKTNPRLARIMENANPEGHALSDIEYDTAHAWIKENKDSLPGELKWGLLKLINGEEYRRAIRSC